VYVVDMMFLADECENAIETCRASFADVPLSEEFDSEAFEEYCR